MKFKVYKGETLLNALVTRKIDGVRAHNTRSGALSRAGKPLHNVILHCEVAEVFCGSWEATVSRVRTHVGIPVASEDIYPILPTIDKRLVIGTYALLTPEVVAKLFKQAQNDGYEGLVIQSEGVYYKLKGTETHDVPIIAVVPGKGKHTGKMGALLTPMGKVGTGFTDVQREWSWKVGDIIEVECMELTPDGKMRHPRFVRLREDK